MLLTAATTGAIPFLIQRTADDVFVAKNAQMVYWITAAIVVVTIVKAVSEYVADVTVAYLGHRFVADLRLQMFAQTRARRSQLDPEGAFGTLALGLSQRRNAHPRHGQPLARHPRRELPQGHHPGRHDVLHGRALLDSDPDLHAGRLVHAVAAAAQDAQIDLPIAAGDGRPFGAHHPDFARHARRARLPPGRQGGGARGLGHQSRARIHHARNARSRAFQPLDRAPHRIGLCARHLLRRHQRRARRPHARPLRGLHDGGASDLHAAQERGHLADAAPGRHRRRKPGVRHHRPRDRLERGARTPSRSSSLAARSSSATCRSPTRRRVPC